MMDDAPDSRTRISIHAPRVGSDGGYAVEQTAHHRFQSTLPVWGATDEQAAIRRIREISIHAPRVGSDAFHRAEVQWTRISIHAPRVGSD